MVETKRRPVLELVAERITNSYKPGDPTDRRLGLVIEGGGMRGIVSGGMANGLFSLMDGKTPFDDIYTSSAGSCAGVYFADGDTAKGLSIYYEELKGRQFIDIRRILKGKAPINTGYLMEVMFGDQSTKQVNFERVSRYPSRIHIMATDAEAAEPHAFREFENGADLRGAVNSSIQIPLYAGSSHFHRGRHYFDAGVLAGRVPLWKAIEDGCSDVLVLWTSKRNNPDYANPFSERPVQAYLRSKFPKLAEKYWYGHDMHRETIRLIQQAQQEEGPVKIDVIRVEDVSILPGTIETRVDRLVRGAIAGRDALLSAMDQFQLPVNRAADIWVPS